jgi:hypothetical protein
MRRLLVRGGGEAPRPRRLPLCWQRGAGAAYFGAYRSPLGGRSRCDTMRRVTRLRSLLGRDAERSRSALPAHGLGREL